METLEEKKKRFDTIHLCHTCINKYMWYGCDDKSSLEDVGKCCLVRNCNTNDDEIYKRIRPGGNFDRVIKCLQYKELPL